MTQFSGIGGYRSTVIMVSTIQSPKSLQLLNSVSWMDEFVTESFGSE